MITSRLEFETIGGAVAYLVGQDFHQDYAGLWHRADDGAIAVIGRLAFSFLVRIHTSLAE